MVFFTPFITNLYLTVPEYLLADGVTCAVCGKVNSNPANARRHVRFVHLGYSEAVGCTVCGKLFARKQFLHRHMRNQHGVLEMR
jgi:hypothetical protein